MMQVSAWLVLPLVAVAFAGCTATEGPEVPEPTGAVSVAPGTECPAHEHASFLVVVRGQNITFQHGTFDMNSPQNPSGVFPMKAHLHKPNDWKLHIEFECTSMSQFFAYMGAELAPGHLKLDSLTNQGSIYDDSGGERLRFFLRDAGTWNEKPDLPAHQARDGQRMLITYGAETADEIATQQSWLKDPAKN